MKRCSLARPDIVEAARSLVGKKFKHHGRGPDYFDCIGHNIEAHRLAGRLPAGFRDETDYPRRPDYQRLIGSVKKWLEPCKPEAGAVVLFGDSGWAHMGIISPTTLIHAYIRNRCVVEHRFDEQWQSLARSYWRIPT